MLKKSFTWTIGGEAGYGINASGLIFSKTLTRLGFHIFDYIEYPSLVRGGHNVYSVRGSSDEVFSQERGIDVLVALNRETFDRHQQDLKKDALAIYNGDQFEIKEKEVKGEGVKLVHVPLSKITQEAGAKKVMENMVALGASMALLGLNLKSLFSVIGDIFGKKGEQIVGQNQKVAQAGFDYIRANYQKWALRVDKPRGNRGAKMVVTGNDAIALGAVLGGCQFYAAYPMTPSSSILHSLAGWAEKTGMVVKHAEDEISVINMAIGASFAGARSALATSGGGFALMQEAVSLAGVTETPVVIIECQRSGPATGMPTWTEQADLQFIIRSGHGDFPKIVLAPGDQEEAIYLTAEALNLADIYQCPVFVLSDKYLSESHKSVETKKIELEMKRFKIDRGKLLTGKQASNSYLRYKITNDGISPRAIPGMKSHLFLANSYEHVEDGHTTEDIEERIKQVGKRARKMTTFIQEHLPRPKLYGEKSADITLIGWGSTKLPALQAVLDCQRQDGNSSVNYFHLNYLWPFPKEAVARVLRQARKVLLLEGNSTAQVGQLIRQETGIEIKNQYLKYDGRPFYPAEIIERIKKF